VGNGVRRDIWGRRSHLQLRDDGRLVCESQTLRSVVWMLDLERERSKNRDAKGGFLLRRL
jgi:hypothetical protein